MTESRRICIKCSLHNMLTKLNAQEITTIGFYPTKPLLEGKISFKLLLQHMKGIYFYMSNDICVTPVGELFIAPIM